MLRSSQGPEKCELESGNLGQKLIILEEGRNDGLHRWILRLWKKYKVVIWKSCCEAIWFGASLHEKCQCTWLLSPEVTAWYTPSPPSPAVLHMPMLHGNSALCIMENILKFPYFCLWEILTWCSAIAAHLYSLPAL